MSLFMIDDEHFKNITRNNINLAFRVGSVSTYFPST